MDAVHKSKIYVVHSDPNAPKDFGSARQYGRLVYCVTQPFHNSDLGQAETELTNKMSDVTSLDWIIPTGNPALIAIAGRIMSEKIGMVRILTWDRFERQYTPYESSNGAT